VVEQEERRVLRVHQSFATATGENVSHEGTPLVVAFR
jgi:hypothetical protein